MQESTRIDAERNMALAQLQRLQDVEQKLLQAEERFDAERMQAEERFDAVKTVNAALTNELAIAKTKVDFLSRVESALTRVALADTVATQLLDVRDRLASRLELLTSEVDDVRRRVDSAGQQDGSDETRRLYLDLLESALTGVLARDGNAAPWGTEEFDPERRLYGRDWPKSAMTMIGTARMRNLRRLVETTLAEGVAGDLLEAGVMARRRLYLHARNPGRACGEEPHGLGRRFLRWLAEAGRDALSRRQRRHAPHLRRAIRIAR